MTIAQIADAEAGASVRSKLNAAISTVNAITPRYVAGRWYLAFPQSVATGTVLPVNTVRLIPFVVVEPITISDLQARVITAVGASNFQLGIYATDSAGLPAGTPIAKTGNMSGASAAVVQAALDAGNVSLPAGLYWAGIQSDGAIALQAPLNSTPVTSYLVGSTTGANLQPGTTTTMLCYVAATTFGTWPNLTSSPPTETANNNAVATLAFKVASVP